MAEKSRLPERLTLTELMELVGVTRQAIDRHVDTGIILRLARDQYDVSSVRRYIAFVRESDGVSPERRRLAAARAKKAELEAAALAGELVPASEIETVWCSITATVRAHMLAIPSKCAGRVGMCKNAAEVQALLRREIAEALLELSKVTFIGGDASAADGGGPAP